MKSLKIAKFQFADSILSLKMFYAIYILIIIFIMIVLLGIDEQGSTTASKEYSSVVFLFVVGVVSFKNTFKFSQANNVSRKAFFQGLLMGLVPIALLVDILDLIINRICNIFLPSPTNYDMFYGNANLFDASKTWVQNNDILTLIGTTVFQFALYLMVMILGVLISLIFYRTNRLTRIIVSVIPVLLIMFSYNIFKLFPLKFWSSVGKFLANAFGLETGNAYMAVLSLTVLSLIFAGIAYLFNRRVVVKER